MKFSISAALVFAGLSQVLAVPANTTLSARDYINCGTTSNAVASDCDKLFTLNFSLNYGKGHTCRYWYGFTHPKAFNPVCLGTPGNCCIYTTDNKLTPDEIKKWGRELMKCRSIKENRINGVIETPKGDLCISDGKGCGDCFGN